MCFLLLDKGLGGRWSRVGLGFPGPTWAPGGGTPLLGYGLPELGWKLVKLEALYKGGFHSRLNVLLLNHLHSLKAVQGN